MRRAAALLLLAGLAAAQDAPSGKLEAKAGRQRREFGPTFYIVQAPDSYTPKKRYGLFVQLHGSNGRAEATVGTFGMALQKDYLLMAPETVTPDRGAWNDAEDCKHIRGMVEELQTVFSIDPDRIFVSGVSAGGATTPHVVARSPDLFTAANPCAGATIPDGIEKAKHVPFYVFAGKKDFLYTNAKMTYEHLRDAGFDAIFDDPDNVGHAVPADARKRIWEWFDGLLPDADKQQMHAARDLVDARAWGRAAQVLKRLADSATATKYAKTRASLLLDRIETEAKKALDEARALAESGDRKKAIALLAKARTTFSGTSTADEIDRLLKELRK